MSVTNTTTKDSTMSANTTTTKTSTKTTAEDYTMSSTKTIKKPAITSGIKVNLISEASKMISITVANKEICEWCVNNLFKYYDGSQRSFLYDMQITSRNKDENGTINFNSMKYPLSTNSLKMNTLFFNEDYTIYDFINWLEYTCNNIFLKKYNNINLMEYFIDIIEHIESLDFIDRLELKLPFSDGGYVRYKNYCSYEYNSKGDLCQKVNSDGSVEEYQYIYDKDGNLIKKTFPNGSVVEYDADGDLMKVTFKNGTYHCYSKTHFQVK